jgi:signal transduction histidine kinase
VAVAVLAAWPRRVRPLAPLLPIAYAAVAVLVVGAARRSQVEGLTTYAGTSTAADGFDLVAGLALLAAASTAIRDATTAAAGRLVIAAGVVWFAQDFEGWSGGPAVVRSLGGAAVPLLVVPPALLVASAIRSRWLRLAVRAGTVVVSVTAVVRALVRDPLLDPYCWRDCVSRSLVVHAEPSLVRTLDNVWLGTTVALGVVVLVAGAEGIVASRGASRRMLAPILVPAALACGAAAMYAAALLRRPLEQPRSAVYSALFYTRAVAFAALGAGLLLIVARRLRQRAAVSRLADELGAVPDALANAFGDPTVEVAYWLPAVGRYVDSEGRAVDPPTPATGRAVTPIVRGGNPVAVVMHDASLTGSLDHELGSAARLAIENERLQAEVHAQLEALRRSRMRITERGESERRRLERDLHDGAQQRLLALSFDLRLARSAVETDGDERLARMLATAVDEAQAALEELRELAHGIYPAVLTEAGLSTALATLADEAPLPVELTATAERFDAPVEAALYVAVREAIDDAARRGATWVRVTVDGRVALSVEDDGVARSSTLVHVADRIGALGGETAFGSNSVRVEVPCA